jgi:hypothetical protein
VLLSTVLDQVRLYIVNFCTCCIFIFAPYLFGTITNNML